MQPFKSLIPSAPSIRLATLLVCACFASASFSMTLRELRSLEKVPKQGDNYVNYYLVGAMEGTLEAHAHNVRNGAKPVICPNGRRPEPRAARALFDAELQRNAEVYEADMPVSLVLANALAMHYPC